MISNTLYKSNCSLNLWGHNNKFNFLRKLYISKKLPKILMLTGKKGIGKSTLITHLLNFIFDEENYDLNNLSISANSLFFKKYLDNTFSNTIYLSGDDFKNVKIDDIRNLKSQLTKSSLLNRKRFIVLDDIELFNKSSLNGLLKLIEEPSDSNNFILINNKTKPLLETIYSRSLEIKINLPNLSRIKIIDLLVKDKNLDVLIDYENISLTPGNFLIFNNILFNNKINIDDDYLVNLEKILKIYKKNKDINLINLIILLTDYYFYNLKMKNYNIENIVENKLFITNSINNLITYNLNQNSFLNAINRKLSNE